MASRLEAADPEGWAQMTDAERADVVKAEAMSDREYGETTMARVEDNMRESEPTGIIHSPDCAHPDCVTEREAGE
jgi:hypothetical protein